MESADLSVSASSAAAEGTAGAGGGRVERVSGAPGVTAVDGDVCSPAGFRAAGVHCGLKYRKPDLALLVSDRPAAAAGVFTTNRVQAAPVRYSRRVVQNGEARAVVVNSANANACTGEQGDRDAEQMARLTGRALGMDPGQVLVASTGVIGVPLPMDRVRAGILSAAGELGPEAGDAPSAILTTDRWTKTGAARFSVDGRTWTVGGMAKGAGMIHPRMATTLGFLTTDAPVPAPVLREALREAVAGSFNRITVDGETSTNDAVVALANGSGRGTAVDGGDALEGLTAAMSAVARSLALEVVRDGEGATTVARISVTGATGEAEARAVAERLATSPLVKTALHGGDPNWGRLMAAAGSAGVEMDPGSIGVWVGDVRVVEGGTGVAGAEEDAAGALAGDQVEIRVDLGAGAARHHIWTCDLSEEYVRVNGSYSS